jgi:DNA repair photolyase
LEVTETAVKNVECRTALSESRLPGLDWALNPYRGCSHGCLYCYVQDVTRFALDRQWGTTVEAKINIASKLKKELAKGLEGVVGVGTVTDPYQPVEADLELTRSCLSVLKRYGARISILTKSCLVLRDLDMIEGWEAAEVGMSIACLDEEVTSILEPAASPPTERFEALRRLSAHGVDVYLMAAPIVPSLTDSEDQLEALVDMAYDSGVRRIMWDGFNPRPLATERLLSGFPLLRQSVDRGRCVERSARSREVLASRCRSRGIALVDAF